MESNENFMGACARACSESANMRRLDCEFECLGRNDLVARLRSCYDPKQLPPDEELR